MLGRENGKTRRGPGAEKFEANQVLDSITSQSIQWIDERAEAFKTGQTFLHLRSIGITPYTNCSHGSLAKQKRNQLLCGLCVGDRCCGGRIMDKLKEEGLLENTLVFFYK